MKHYPHMHVPPFGASQNISGWERSDRTASLVILTFPFILGLAAFLLAVVTSIMGGTQVNSPHFYMAAFSFSYLVFGVFYLPA